MTLREALTEASQQITRRDAETLLAHLLSHDRAWLLAHADDAIEAQVHASLRELTARRASNEPLQHLTGTQEFFCLPLRVTRDVLIPRPETEHLVEAVLDWARAQSQPRLGLVDVGTGSGAIALALAANLPQAEITALDISPAALEIARDNADRTGLTGRVRFLQSDLLAAVSHEGPFDAIVSNPPYVAETDAATLAPEVRDHEPSLALYAGPEGLEIYGRLIPAAHSALRPGGLLAMEIGYGQRGALTALLSGWHNIRFIDDYAGIPRVALALRP